MKPTLTTFSDIAGSIDNYHSNPNAYKGKSTGSPKLDEFITLKEGNLHVITGIPSSGKSELLDQIMLNTVALHDWHWAVFSPENWPLEAHFQKVCEKWTGKPWASQGCTRGVTNDDVIDTRAFLSQHISFIDTPDGMMTLDTFLEGCRISHEEHGTNAADLDPWNELEAKAPKGMSETNYISECLSKIRNFGRKHDMAMFIVAHPTKLQKNENGNYPVPTPYDINGSAAWRNKADVCLSVWRNYQMNDGVVQAHVQKVRNKMLGRLGMTELHWLWTNGIFMEDEHEVCEGERFAIKKLVEQ